MSCLHLEELARQGTKQLIATWDKYKFCVAINSTGNNLDVAARLLEEVGQLGSKLCLVSQCHATSAISWELQFRAYMSNNTYSFARRNIDWRAG